ncbi:MAG: lipid A biosynthesis acyltransferase [Burkholderiales bacterium]|nr:lipid A biosynthesis acyltransferase [Burkholderiales bacterium]
MLTRIALKLLEMTAWMPLPWLRGLGWLLGRTLFWAVPSRRRVVLTNLRLCFPHWTPQQLHCTTVETFVCFAQSWLDRGWLWHGAPDTTRKRLKLVGALRELEGNAPTVIFAPHFMGLDAGWTALTQQVPRAFNTIYTDQANKTSDAWIYHGRKRFGDAQLFGRIDGVKPILAGLKAGQPLYLLPDMNFGPGESVFVPFFGVQAATVPSLSRFARLGRAKVVPVISRMTPAGYDVEVFPAWRNFPSNDPMADTARMNLELQAYIDTMPSQYYWVHKRFKDRPSGEVAPY